MICLMKINSVSVIGYCFSLLHFCFFSSLQLNGSMHDAISCSHGKKKCPIDSKRSNITKTDRTRRHKNIQVGVEWEEGRWARAGRKNSLCAKKTSEIVLLLQLLLLQLLMLLFLLFSSSPCGERSWYFVVCYLFELFSDTLTKHQEYFLYIPNIFIVIFFSSSPWPSSSSSSSSSRKQQQRQKRTEKKLWIDLVHA